MRAPCKEVTLGERLWSRVDKNGPVPAHCPELGPCWVWRGGTIDQGYGQIGLGSTNVGTHRAAFFLTHGRWPEPFCLHKCDNRLCCNPAHLFEGTHAENMADKVAKGRESRGSLHGRAKLTEADVPCIRALASEHVSISEIARRFGVARTPIRRIIAGTAWRHVPAA